MRRDIKFRLWDNLKKEIVFEGFSVFGEVTMFGAIYSYASETRGERSSLERYNDFELMQYTGLKDKNGKEIYEGDIITMLNKRTNLPSLNPHVVYWDKCSFYKKTITESGKEPLSMPLEASPFYNMGEVIGNIYENPELLKRNEL